MKLYTDTVLAPFAREILVVGEGVYNRTLPEEDIL